MLHLSSVAFTKRILNFHYNGKWALSSQICLCVSILNQWIPTHEVIWPHGYVCRSIQCHNSQSRGNRPSRQPADASLSEDNQTVWSQSLSFSSPPTEWIQCDLTECLRELIHQIKRWSTCDWIYHCQLQCSDGLCKSCLKHLLSTMFRYFNAGRLQVTLCCLL